MRYLLMIGLCTLSLVGCGDYWARFRQAQQDWAAYRNSPAYYETTTTHVFQGADGRVTRCDVTCGRYDCRTTCY